MAVGWINRRRLTLEYPPTDVFLRERSLVRERLDSITECLVCSDVRHAPVESLEVLRPDEFTLVTRQDLKHSAVAVVEIRFRVENRVIRAHYGRIYGLEQHKGLENVVKVNRQSRR